MQAVPDNLLATTLLTLGRTVVLQLDAALAITGAHNRQLLDEWREPGAHDAGAPLPATLSDLLRELMAPARARDLGAHIAASANTTGAAGLYLGVSPLHSPRGGSGERHAALSLHRCGEQQLMLVMRDVTALGDLQQQLAHTQTALDAAMAALRAPPRELRMFLGSALTSISAIRATLRMPARDAAALHEKLARLHAAVAQLGGEAGALNLVPVQDACQALLARLDGLLEREELTGDALLPLAALVDRIAGSAGLLWRIEEQRHVDPQPSRTRGRRQPDWAFATERRWASFLHHRGEEIGVLVGLEMEGAANVPRHMRASIDGLLQHMLRNAVEQGIETPEERLAAGKPATGRVTVKFEVPGTAQLRMTVRDDGRGRAIGLNFLRKAVAELGGTLAEASRPEQYSQLVIELPQDGQREARALAGSQ